MSEKRFAEGQEIAIRKARALAEREGVVITDIEWVGDKAEEVRLRIYTSTRKEEFFFPYVWIEHLPNGVFTPFFDERLLEFIRALKAPS